jgi:hypothetical protein
MMKVVLAAILRMVEISVSLSLLPSLLRQKLPSWQMMVQKILAIGLASWLD